MSEPATFYFSFDFECGWGAIADGKWREREAAGVYAGLRPLFQRLLPFLDAHSLPVTFATVGGMIDPEAREKVEFLKGDIQRKTLTFLDESNQDTQDGRDLLEAVMLAEAGHIVQSHSYSHVSFNDPAQDADSIRKDLEYSHQTLKEYGVNATRFVFPQNHANHFEVLKQCGFSEVRMPARASLESAANSRLSAIVKQQIGYTTRFVETERDPTGLLLHYGSHFLNWGQDRSFLRRVMTQRNAFNLLDNAVKNQKPVHMWVHPWNLVHTQGLENHFYKVFEKVAHYRERGLLKLGTF